MEKHGSRVLGSVPVRGINAHVKIDTAAHRRRVVSKFMPDRAGSRPSFATYEFLGKADTRPCSVVPLRGSDVSFRGPSENESIVFGIREHRGGRARDEIARGNGAVPASRRNGNGTSNGDYVRRRGIA